MGFLMGKSLFFASCLVTIPGPPLSWVRGCVPCVYLVTQDVGVSKVVIVSHLNIVIEVH